MKNYQPIWIGFIDKNEQFQAVWTIYRQKINSSLIFRKEKYKCINKEWGFYVKEN